MSYECSLKEYSNLEDRKLGETVVSRILNHSEPSYVDLKNS